ncbi:MAG TPA: class I adenylate-forming enzyme family protein [Burkholderiales bacterium]|nr:class I adenylate-forming enzyme family protein [Burkholderiales bacterium]
MKFHQLLVDGASRRPDQTALHWVDRDRRLTYAEAAAGMERVAGALATLGVKKGDRVGIFAHNGNDYVLAMFGAWRLGAISAHINVQYADTLDYYLGDCTPSVLIYTGDHLPTIQRHRAAAKSVKHYICMDGPQEGALAWNDLLKSAPAAPPASLQDADGAHLSYTSGSTGKPKGALLAHEPTFRACRCIAERLRYGPSDVTYAPGTLSSSNHLVVNLIPGLFAGATLGIVTKWNAARAWEDMERLGSTVVPTNAANLAELLEECRRRGRAPRALRLGVTGGGPTPPALKKAWRDELKVTLSESFGQSELGGFVGLGPPEPPPDGKLLACGPSLPDREVRIVDPRTGREVPIGQSGEIAITGGCMLGYWGRPEKTAEVNRDGWLYTGDVGRMDADGYVYVRGRASERVTVSGEPWYPRDVEEALLEHSEVSMAALIGLPDEKLGERPVVYLVMREGAKVSDRELLASAAPKIGRDLGALSIKRVPSLPVTPTGKISKAELKQQAA